MSFLNVHNAAEIVRQNLKTAKDNLLSFGVSFLDDAMIGILKNDLILVGARSGAGKTQFCVNVALANVRAGKRVHFLALEAEQGEIETRIIFQFFQELFTENRKNWMAARMTEKNDELRMRLDAVYSKRFSYQQFALGETLQILPDLTNMAIEKLDSLEGLHTFYKSDKFDVRDFMLKVLECDDETDLIICDHVHYFDYDDDAENKSIKEIAKTARTLALENGKPIILVSHLRKSDKNGDLVPSLEEFHGSSDLYKIATKAITLAPGAWNAEGKMQTFVRIVKNRFDGSVTRVIGAVNYLISEGRYEIEYKIGDANQKRDSGFTALEPFNYPQWARLPANSPRNNPSDAKKLPNYADKHRGQNTL
jgi:KaiC/GvpD/RAD55 family RecA-like ATPase